MWRGRGRLERGRGKAAHLDSKRRWRTRLRLRLRPPFDNNEAELLSRGAREDAEDGGLRFPRQIQVQAFQADPRHLAQHRAS